MTVTTYDKSDRGRTLVRILESSPHPEWVKEIIVLPIPTTRDGDNLPSGESLDSVCSAVRGGTVVVGWGIPKKYTEKVTRAGGYLIDSSLDGQLVEDNACLTALGALGILLTRGCVSPTDIRIGIVGYGRIGRRLTRMLLCLGCSPTVYTRRRSVALELIESGVDAVLVGEGDVVPDCDVLVNTSPSVIFPLLDDAARGDMEIIELASGDNFPTCAVTRYPSLPAVMYPKSAGEAWARSVIRMIGGLYE